MANAARTGYVKITPKIEVPEEWVQEVGIEEMKRAVNRILRRRIGFGNRPITLEIEDVIGVLRVVGEKVYFDKVDTPRRNGESGEAECEYFII